MDVGAFFVSLQYLSMGLVFMALVLIFLYAYFGKDEEEVRE